jgi:demethylspheroidene O-methyltransferase
MWWAAGFWLTRPLVRRRAGELFDLVAGFVYSQVLLACVRLDLFNHLADGPDTASRLVGEIRQSDATVAGVRRALGW